MSNDMKALHSFLKATDIDPKDDVFTIDKDPSTIELENQHKPEEWIYDRFSKLSPESQVEVLKKLEASGQLEAIRNLIFHAIPDTSPSNYCMAGSDILEQIKGKYPPGAFPLFSKWANDIPNSDDVHRIKRMMSIMPAGFKYGTDYEIYCYFNHYNQLQKIAILILNEHDSRCEDIAEGIKTEFKGEERGSFSVGYNNRLSPREALELSRLKGVTFRMEIGFNSDPKLTGTDKTVLEELQKRIGAKYDFIKGNEELRGAHHEDIAIKMDNEEWLDGMAFAVKVKDTANADKELEELGTFAQRILNKANAKAAPDKYSIERNFLTKQRGTATGLVIHINKRSVQSFKSTLTPFPLACPRVFKVEENDEQGLDLIEAPYHANVNIRGYELP